MQFYDLFNNYKNSLKEIKGTIPFMICSLLSRQGK